MAKFTLVKIAPTGKRTAVTDGFEPESLIETGILLLRKCPDTQFGVTDDRGYFVWPELWAKAHISPESYHPIVKQDYM